MDSYISFIRSFTKNKGNKIFQILYLSAPKRMLCTSLHNIGSMPAPNFRNKAYYKDRNKRIQKDIYTFWNTIFSKNDKTFWKQFSVTILFFHFHKSSNAQLYSSLSIWNGVASSLSHPPTEKNATSPGHSYQWLRRSYSSKHCYGIMLKTKLINQIRYAAWWVSISLWKKKRSRKLIRKVHVNLTVDQIPFQHVRKRKGL